MNLLHSLVIIILIICVYYGMTVAHQYSTMKNYTDTISHTVKIISKQSYTQSYIAVQQYYVSTYRNRCLRWLCDIQLMGVLHRLEK